MFDSFARSALHLSGGQNQVVTPLDGAFDSCVLRGPNRSGASVEHYAERSNEPIELPSGCLSVALTLFRKGLAGSIRAQPRFPLSQALDGSCARSGGYKGLSPRFVA